MFETEKKYSTVCLKKLALLQELKYNRFLFGFFKSNVNNMDILFCRLALL